MFFFDIENYSPIKEVDYNKRPAPIELLQPSITQTSKQRVSFQNSIFVRAKEGYIPIDTLEVETIAKDLKQPVRDYLKKFHGIDTNTIYNDLIGFIQNEENYETRAIHFYRGLSLQEREEYEEAIKEYDKAIALKPGFAKAYNNLELAIKKVVLPLF